MSIKARFFVAEFNEVVVGGGGRQATAVMRAVRRETDDNIQWSKYTPAGEIKMTVTQEEGGAFEAFRALMGKDVSITIDEIRV